jgi:GT2 family glycosyltransferase
MEITVVDNASTDNSLKMVRTEFPEVRLIENTRNLGFARACNQGIDISQGRYVMLLNSDARVENDALRLLVRFADANPEAGIIGPKVLNPDGSLQYSCRRFPTLAAGLFRHSFLGCLFPHNPYTRDYLMADWHHREPQDVDWVSGAAMLIRKGLLEDVGLLDERFYMYCEDVDLAYRAREKGWSVVYFPEAVVVHAKGRSSDKDPNRMIREFHKSMYRFFRKHYAPSSSIVTRGFVPLALFLRASLLIAHNQFDHYRYVLTHPKRGSEAEERYGEGYSSEG